MISSYVANVALIFFNKMSVFGFTDSNGRNELALCLLVSSADNLYKQFGPILGPTKCWPDLDSIRLTLRWYSEPL